MWNGTARMDQSLLWVALHDLKQSSDIRSLMTSMLRFQSAFGPCGMMGNNIPFNSYIDKDGRKVCVMPAKSAERMISFHRTGGDKEAGLNSWINWTFDEKKYIEESRTLGDAFHPARKVPRLVFPDW